MYKFYLDNVLLPITPSKLQIKTDNKNKTLTLMDGNEMNVLNYPGLMDISFDAILPHAIYPFGARKKYREPYYFIKKLEQLKHNRKPFQFRVIRLTQNGNPLFWSDLNVSLENYTITEDANNGLDIIISISLKQYRAYKIKKVDVVESKDEKEKTSNPVKKEERSKSPTKIIVKNERPAKLTPNTYTVKKGDTLWGICKKQLGDASKCWDIAKLNKISNPNLIYPGQVIKFE